MSFSYNSLQNLMKRDTSAYTNEFKKIYAHFLTYPNLLRKIRTQNYSVQKNQAHRYSDLVKLIQFLSHTVPLYAHSNEIDNNTSDNSEDLDLEHPSKFPAQLINLLDNDPGAVNLHHNVRRVIVQALILLRNRQFIDHMTVFPTFFNLLGFPDKETRHTIFHHIINDISRSNRPKYNQTLNSIIQKYLYSVLSSDNEISAKRSLDIVVELYRRCVWRDSRTVNLIANTCFQKHRKPLITALRFFLGQYPKITTDTTENDLPKERIKTNINDEFENENDDEDSFEITDLSAIRLLNDPYTFSCKLFSLIHTTNISPNKHIKTKLFSFQIKLLLINVISRIISSHKLVIENFYTYFLHFINHNQKEITQILVCFVQACHELVPLDCLMPCVRKIAQEFITDIRPPNFIAFGLNTIREVCNRRPEVMTSDLLADLVIYKKSKDKGIIMAARSLIGLFRKINPKLLQKKERGKEAQMKLQEEDKIYDYEDKNESDDVDSDLNNKNENDIIDNDNESSFSNVHTVISPSFNEAVSETLITDFTKPTSLLDKKTIRKNAMIEKKASKEKWKGIQKGGGLTNREKRRHKNAVLVKRSSRVKIKAMSSLSSSLRKRKANKIVDKRRKKLRRRL